MILWNVHLVTYIIDLFLQQKMSASFMNENVPKILLCNRGKRNDENIISKVKFFSSMLYFS